MEVAGLLNDDRKCIVKLIDCITKLINCIRNDIGDALKPVKRKETYRENFKIFAVSYIAGAFIRSVTF